MTEAQALLQEGLAAFKARAYNDALRAWRALLNLEPDNTQVRDLVSRTEALAAEGQVVNLLREELADLRAELASTRESRNELLLEMARIHRRYEEREARLWRAQEAREWELREALAKAELQQVQGFSSEKEVEYDALQMQVASLRNELSNAHARIVELEQKLGAEAHVPTEFDGIPEDAGDEDLFFGGLIDDTDERDIPRSTWDSSPNDAFIGLTSAEDEAPAPIETQEDSRPITTTARPLSPTNDWPLTDNEPAFTRLERTSTSSQPAPVFAPEEPLIEPVISDNHESFDVLVSAVTAEGRLQSPATSAELKADPFEAAEETIEEDVPSLISLEESVGFEEIEELSNDSTNELANEETLEAPEQFEALFDFSAIEESSLDETIVEEEQPSNENTNEQSSEEAIEAISQVSAEDREIIDSLQASTSERSSDTAEYTDETLNDENLIEGFSDGLASALGDTPDPPRLETGIVPILPDLSFDLEEEEDIYVHELHGKSTWIPVVCNKRPDDISAIASYLISHIDGVSSFAELRGTVGLPAEAVDKGFLELIAAGALRARRPN